MPIAGPPVMADPHDEASALPVSARLVEILNRWGVPEALQGHPDSGNLLMLQKDLYKWKGTAAGADSRPSIQLRLLPRDDGGRAALATPVTFLDELRRKRQKSSSRVRVGPLALPRSLAAVARRLEDSLSILELEDDWDDAGSPGYSRSTWERAATLVVDAVRGYRRAGHRGMPIPQLNPGPDGSIDIAWERGSRRLLVNVPEEPANVATFFGRDLERPGEVLRGETDPATGARWLLHWLDG